MRWLTRFFARQPAAVAQSDVLPADVLAALEAANIIPRVGAHAADTESETGGETRAIIMLPGRRGFRFDGETGARALRSAFPELNDAQVARGVRFLSARAAIAAQDKEAWLNAEPEPPKWSDWKPLPRW
ncbi:hypothetical protein LJR296_002440 [Cupriavidus necator]|uniref:hypothetical protein n=1 Tax=Cupriavidus necator TaxID=106590 RepID=UPI003ED0FD17